MNLHCSTVINNQRFILWKKLMPKSTWEDGIKCFEEEILRILVIVVMQNIYKRKIQIIIRIMKKAITCIIFKMLFFIGNIKVTPQLETNLTLLLKQKLEDFYLSQISFQETLELNFYHFLQQLHIKYLILTTSTTQ